MGAFHRLVSGDWPHIEHLRRWYPEGHGRCHLSCGHCHHLQLEHRRGVELCHRHSTGLWPRGHVGRLCPRREHPGRHPHAPLAVREVEEQRIRERITVIVPSRLFSIHRSGAKFLSVLAPGEDPTALAARDGVA